MIYWILAILASYRVARMIALEDGAFDVFTNIRGKLESWNSEHWITRGLNCPLCIGFWASLAFALVLAHQDSAMGRSEILLAWLGIAGAQTILHLLIEK